MCDKKEYIPKGGMCAVCLFSNEDCSKIDFRSMAPIKKPKNENIIIVKCDAFYSGKDGK